ncbi:hypothetical protein ACHWQZ_G003131 [Mnemiopsis leidyi]
MPAQFKRHYLTPHTTSNMSELNKRGRSKRKTRESGNDDLNTGKDQPKFKKLTLDDYRKRDTESSDSRAGTSTPPQTPPIPYTPVDKEFTMKETSPVNNEELRPRTETTQIVPPLPSMIKGKEAITTEPELPELYQSTELPEQDQSTETPPLLHR